MKLEKARQVKKEARHKEAVRKCKKDKSISPIMEERQKQIDAAMAGDVEALIQLDKMLFNWKD